ncbi:MAG TPA: hypothetical protein VGM44_16285 [Polyangiaceae bacterium]|jgi:hypothetical protein
MLTSRVVVLQALLLCAAGCADARGRFEDFQSRLAQEPDSGSDADDGGPCTPPDPNVVGGPALLALDTNLIPGEPVLFLGTIDTPPLDGTTAVHYVYHAVDAEDRHTLVGDALEVGPFALTDGLLTALVPESTLDGRANPQLYGTPIDSKMTLSGHICGVKSFYCGTLTGITSGLISGPFSGHFGITLLPSLDAVPAQPRFGCDASDVAAPLASANQ